MSHFIGATLTNIINMVLTTTFMVCQKKTKPTASLYIENNTNSMRIDKNMLSFSQAKKKLDCIWKTFIQSM